MAATLVELRRKAEDAVRDMPEGPMKVKAFETILSHLLTAGDATPAPAPRRAVKSRQRETATTGGTPQSCADRILFLKGEDFFASQRSIGEIREELKKNGWHYPVTSLSGPLQSLVQKRELRRENVNIGPGRKAWKYANS